MPLLLDTARSPSTVDLRGRNCLTVGLVNNMPDAACEATERQFLDLLRAASGNVIVRLKLYAIADVPRAEAVRQELGARYRDIADLWDTPLDGLIVTGTEPCAANLQDEPYWPALSRLVDWARDNTASTVWSCLAAHAAVLHADGIARQPLETKLSGVFDCAAVTDHPLLADVAPRLRVPHSRLNDLPEPALRSRGYRVLSRSATAGNRCLRQGGRGLLAVPFLPRSPGIRRRFIAARIPPRRRPLPARRTRRLSGAAARLFQQRRDVPGERFSHARHG
jgi:homoserine O-succinyltransferase